MSSQLLEGEPFVFVDGNGWARIKTWDVWTNWGVLKTTVLNLFDPDREALKHQPFFSIPRLLDDAIDCYDFPPMYAALHDLQTQPVISDKLAKFYGIGKIEGVLKKFGDWSFSKSWTGLNAQQQAAALSLYLYAHMLSIPRLHVYVPWKKGSDALAQ